MGFVAHDLGVDLGTSGIDVDVINSVTGELGSVQITLANDGEFGFALTLTAPLGKENAGYWANLYHYGEAGETLDFETSAHDETFLKDNLEYLFLYRQLTNFEAGREEPSYGWLYGVTYNAEALIRYMAQAMDVPEPPPIPVWTESKQRQREALKKLAHGQRLENTENFEEDEGYSFGMSM